MKYIVKVADKSYEVEIEDIHARPVLARVDGQEFQVSPEDGSKQASKIETKEFKPIELSKPPSSSNVGTSEMTAPLPGTVIEVFVKPGDTIETGQVILVIEAMKMKNSRVMNMILLGAYLRIQCTVSLDSVLEALKKVLPEKYHHTIPLNEQASRGTRTCPWTAG